MKKNQYYLFSVLIIAVALFASCNSEKEEKKDGPKAEPNAWLFAQRAYPHNEIDATIYRNAHKEASRMHKENTSRAINWELAGPTNIGGRITDIEVDPNNNDIIYLGAATGGVWKSEDFGENWDYKFQDVPFTSVGDIALDPNNPQTIYVGTGEANSASMSFYGGGVYKSEDGGNSWNYSGLEGSPYFGKIVVDYNNSNRVFAAACGTLFTPSDERGVYRTTDGGENWEQVLFVTDTTSAIDLVQDPNNPDILYAAMWERIRSHTARRSFGHSSGVWKTVDGGDTWERLEGGLPYNEDAGRIGLAIGHNNSEIVYAFYDMPDQVSDVYKTVNGGTSWNETSGNNLDGMCSYFGWYFGKIAVDPKDDDKIFVMGVDLYRSTNGGGYYQQIAGYYNMSEIHVDHHAMWIDPASDMILEGNDGGLYKTTSDGSSWDKINNLPFSQFYDIAFDYQQPERLYGGTQDNSSIRTWDGGIDDWEVILGGDGMYTLVDYTNSNVIYCEYQNGVLHRSSDGGNWMEYIAGAWSSDRVNWSAPYVIHPTNPLKLYFGSYRIYKTSNRGNSWQTISGDLTKGGSGSFHTLSTVAISQIDPEIILTGSSDGLVHITTDEGGSWQNISAGLPDRWVTRVLCDPFDISTIYATTSGFRWDENDGHVFMSEDQGESWIDITGNLPNIPVNVIVADPENEGTLIIGTDAGVFATTNHGEYWESVNQGFPVVPVVAISIHNPSRSIAVATHGVSCWKGNLDEINVGINNQEKEIEKTISCYPNPVVDNAQITFVAKKQLPTTISIYDLSGKSVFSKKIENCSKGENKIDLNLSNFSKGTYIVKVSIGNKIESTKIIKQ